MPPWRQTPEALMQCEWHEHGKQCRNCATWRSTVENRVLKRVTQTAWCERHAAILKRSPASAADQWEKLPSSKDE